LKPTYKLYIANKLITALPPFLYVWINNLYSMLRHFSNTETPLINTILHKRLPQMQLVTTFTVQFYARTTKLWKR